ncbi:bifunctional glycosyltransferase/CDP-glycerol:glycerophosphate glycerophosphotransferase [Brevibacterium gallinarum]|uniref:CDP-glycerol glycerophosphotransferase family protein n=1 Tax=Brevibacterium gallinarum TaxID=2762220 RepID=A0ABR8WW31_9MICO|nr:CDP-glycerol glycerophosphotransferase family protein [Brevibacterium gallinarum]MBD8021302.1 CDP-glycerol glycerophosphotransferase family protein [Brevibacterium gallinarum]
MLQRQKLIDQARRAVTTTFTKVLTATGGHVDENFGSAVLRPIRNRRIDTSSPLVSIIVPVYDVEEYLSGTLASLVDQTYGNLEILLIDDGSPDKSAAIGRQWALFDRRIRVISQENQGLGAARNTGVRNARGKYITFADSDDALYPDAIATMVASLESSGSDLAIGAIVRRKNGRIWMPQWVSRVHAADRVGVTLADAPDILPDVFACNKLWRRDFFRAVVGAFPVGILYEDQEPSLAAYLGAKTFDILSAPVYIWEIRSDGTSLSQQKTRMRDLTDRLAVIRRMTQMLPPDTPEHVRDAFYRKIFQLDLWQYIEQVPRVGDEYFSVLCDAVDEFVALSGGGFWTQIPIYHRMLTRAAAEHDYDTIMTVLSSRIEDGAGGHLVQHDATTLLEIPVYYDALETPPEAEFFTVDPDMLEVTGSIIGVRWLDSSRVLISCQAAVASGFSESHQTAAFTLKDTQSGRTIPLKARQISDPYFAETVRSSVVDATETGYTIEVDTAEIPFSGNEDWQLTAHVGLGEYTVSGPLMGIQSDRAAANLGFSAWDGDRKVVLAHSRYFGLVFRPASPQCLLRQVALNERQLRLVVRALNGKRITSLEVFTGAGQRTSARPTGFNRNGEAEFCVEVPVPHYDDDRHPSALHWNVKVRFADRRTAQLLLAEGRRDFDSRDSELRPLLLDCNAFGYLRLQEAAHRIVCTSVTADTENGTLVLRGEANVSRPAAPTDLVFRGRAGDIVAAETNWSDTGDTFEAAFDLTALDWHGRVVSVPHGGYGLHCRIPDPGGTDLVTLVPVRIRDSSVHDLPWRALTRLARVTITRTRKQKVLWLTVANPLSPEELGTFNRYRMREEAIMQARADGLTDTVIFESYHGKSVSDSPRELFELLRREHPELTLGWSIASTAVSAPEGAVPLLRWSAEWYAAVHRARFLINNSNFPVEFRKQPGQRYLQTWHGTPMKRIAEDMPPGNLSLGYRLTMRREAKMWDLLLAQNDFAAEVLPRAFWYQGETLNLGYPRNDLLVSEDPGRVSRIREQLGIASAERVVLYAPTFRDSRKSAGGYDLDIELDFTELLDRLPKETRILVRGHSNTTGAQPGTLPPNVVDVTTYGEISELFLVADVLVTDYSSMLFDFAVTQKPMLFFVPDLEEYESSTRGFYLKFREICPGELFRTTHELADALTRAFNNPREFVTESTEAFASRFAPRDDGRAGNRLLQALEERGWFAQLELQESALNPEREDAH